MIYGTIDGETPLDLDEIDGLKFKHITTRGELNHLEQANIEYGLFWLQRQNNPDILSEKFIRNLHLRLFSQVWKWAGKFRHTEKNIGVDPYQIPIELKKLLEDTKFWIDNKIYDPYEIALRFHHRLVWIHPFANGNGRQARILSDALLEKKFKLKSINWFDRQQYILALQAADKGDFALLLSMI